MVSRVSRLSLLFSLLLGLLGTGQALAKFDYFTEFSTRYPNSPLLSMSCSVCHPNFNTKDWNLYGLQVKAATGTIAERLTKTEPMDADGDGAINLQEINAGTDPSLKTSTPPKPAVTSIVRQNPATQATAAASVVWRVTFSEAVSGVAAADFVLAKPSGGTLAGYSITSVAAVAGTANKSYDVTVNTGSGSGELRLDVAAGATITNTAGMNLGNAPYTAGAAYQIRPNAVRVWTVYD